MVVSARSRQPRPARQGATRLRQVAPEQRLAAGEIRIRSTPTSPKRSATCADLLERAADPRAAARRTRPPACSSGSAGCSGRSPTTGATASGRLSVSTTGTGELWQDGAPAHLRTLSALTLASIIRRMLRPYRGRLPVVHRDGIRRRDRAGHRRRPRSGADSSVWMNAVIRGDVNYIRIGERTNVQDGTVVHVSATRTRRHRRRRHDWAWRDRARLHGRRPRAHRHGGDPAERRR